MGNIKNMVENFWGDFMYYTERLKELREDSDLTQEQVATALGLKREQYRRYETGINEIKASHIIMFAKFYNVSSDYILGLSNKKTYPIA